MDNGGLRLGGFSFVVGVACLVASGPQRATGAAQSPFVVYKAQPADKAAVIEYLDALERGDEVTLKFESRNAFRDAWDQVASAWLKAPDADGDRRRRILALAILQAGHDALDNYFTWREVRWLIEWQCDQLRRGPVTEFEHVWLSASSVVIQAAGDYSFLAWAFSCDRLQPCDHAWHALSRFPEDRHFRFTRALPRLSVKPFARTPGELLADPLFGKPEFNLRLAETFTGLRAFADDPVVGPEVRLKIGLLHYALNELPDCLRELKTASATTDDPYVRYVARFVMGLVHDAEGRADVAIQHYEGALLALPSVRSGATWLAAKYFLAGRREDAFSLMDAVYAAPPPKVDPWHRTNELRTWPDYYARLRELVHR
jgi:tetratricopeptide (TPR) repeat protein